MSGTATAQATGRPSTSAHTAQRGSKIGFSSVASRRNSAAVGGDEAPVLLPGLAVNVRSRSTSRVNSDRSQRPRDDPFARAQALRQPGDDGRRLARDVVDPGEQVLHLAIAGGLEERRILRRVVRHHQHRVAVEPVDEQARALVERWIDRPAHRRPAAALRPGLHRFHQRLCGGGVVGFEKPEHRDVVAVASRCADGRRSRRCGRRCDVRATRGTARRRRGRRRDSFGASAARVRRSAAAAPSVDPTGCDRRRNRRTD